MDGRTRTALALAALVALAGCPGLAPSGGGSADTTPTLTAVPVASPTPTPVPTPMPADFAGITEGNGLDVRDIVESHERYLRDRSFTFVWERRTTGGTGPIATSFERRVAVENASTYLARANGTMFDGTVTTYADSGGAYRRVDPPNGSARTATTPAYDDARHQYARITSSVASVFFVVGATDIGVVERNGRHYVRLFSQTVPDYVAAVYGDYQVENYTMTAWIAPQGYIRTIHYEFTLDNAEGRIHREVRYLYEDVGETTVSAPAWVGAFERNRTATTPTPEPTPPATVPQPPTAPPPPTGPSPTPTPTEVLDATATPRPSPNATTAARTPTQ